MGHQCRIGALILRCAPSGRGIGGVPQESPYYGRGSGAPMPIGALILRCINSERLVVNVSFELFKQLFASPGTRLFKEAPGGKVGEELQDLTPEAWQDHIGDGPHLGAFVQRADGTVQFSMFDIDISPLGAPREEMLRQMEILKPQAIKVRDALMAGGLTPEQVLVEYSGSGYHLWIFFEAPLPAAMARWVMLGACKRAGLDLRYKPCHLEEPAKDRVWLPMRINRSQQVRSVWVADLASFNPAQYHAEVDLEFLAGVRTVEAEKIGYPARG